MGEKEGTVGSKGLGWGKVGRWETKVEGAICSDNGKKKRNK